MLENFYFFLAHISNLPLVLLCLLGDTLKFLLVEYKLFYLDIA